MAASDKSEKPSVQRLRKAREDGQFLVSRGAVSAAQFLVFVVLLGWFTRTLQQNLATSFPALVERAMNTEITTSEWPVLLRAFRVRSATPICELAAALLFATVAAHFAMTRFGFSLKRLTPQVGRFSPASKLKSLPRENFKSVAEAIVLMLVLAGVMHSLVEEHAANMFRLSLQSLPQATAQVGQSVDGLLWKAASLFVVFGSVDLFRQQRRYMGELRMTKQELREESRRAEGDPQMKGRIRRLRRDMLRKQMMSDVPKATAVVVNPTHFAVAIRYDMENMPCPLVVAKGKNWLALRIRQIAVENQVPIIENPPLARALYDAVDVGRAISPEFYKAIAEILAYVYRIMGRRLAA